LLGQVQATAEKASEHQDYPFPLLVERVQPVRDMSRSPIFQVMFVLYEGSGRKILPFLTGESGTLVNLGGMEFECLEMDQRAAMLDLTLTVVEADGRLTASLQYNTDLFDQSTIARMADQLQSLLKEALCNPDARIADLIAAIKTDRGYDSSCLSLSQDGPAQSREGDRMDFSLFYFASEDSGPGCDRYRLLLDGASFADRHGFRAVWTPERHFHAFGGLFPNPSITGAAIAAITERIEIRAGSVVLPLHHPIRIAEEWSVIDNISRGRAGISVASGWHSDDFVLSPENYASRREVMLRHVGIIRRLWRGEEVEFAGVDGDPVAVRALPRPVQSELPIWLTAFGNSETFRAAGQIKANILTHLLGQDLEMLSEKIRLYRKAWREAGNGPNSGAVTVMLHTYVGASEESVRETVRAPFCNYLKSSIDLLAGLTKSSGINLSADNLTPESLDAVANHAFDRYYRTSALFGTPETCLRMVERLKAAGVDEIACLIDFGLDFTTVMAGLNYLDMVKNACGGNRHGAGNLPDPDKVRMRPAFNSAAIKARVENRRALTARNRSIRSSGSSVAD
jgi:natural product biosynthesis luciferase-like monooxygenase protein